MQNILKELDSYLQEYVGKKVKAKDHEIDVIHTSKRNWYGKLINSTEFSIRIDGKVPEVDFFNAEAYYTKYFTNFCNILGLQYKFLEICIHRDYDKVKKLYSNDNLRIYVMLEFKDK